MTASITRKWLRPIRLVLPAVIVLPFLAYRATATDERGSPSLRVAVRHVEPFVFLDGERPKGFSIDVVESLARDLQMRVDYVVRHHVDEILAAVRDGSADIAIGAITITAEREAEFDFSHPFYRSGLRVAVPVRATPTWLSSLWRFASLDFLAMLGTIGGVTLLAAHLLWAIERRVNPDCFPATYISGVGEALWWSVATIITGGCENKAPVSLFGRLVAVAWMLGSIMLVASFTATLASQMTTETVSGAITGPDSLPGRMTATIANTTAEDDLRSLQARVLPCPSLDTAIDAAVAGRADAVVFDAPVIGYHIAHQPSISLRLAGPMFEHCDYGIALQRGSGLRKPINQALLRLTESSELAALNAKWFGERD
jgi:ABC-type amino acid transport substrate-binding protein